MTANSKRSVQPRWTREQIRDARLAPLAPLLEQLGHQLRETGGGNFAVTAFPGLILKDAYWRCPRATAPATPSTSAPKSSGCRFTTPCSPSPRPEPTRPLRSHDDRSAAQNQATPPIQTLTTGNPPRKKSTLPSQTVTASVPVFFLRPHALRSTPS